MDGSADEHADMRCATLLGDVVWTFIRTHVVVRVVEFYDSLPARLMAMLNVFSMECHP